MQNYDTLYPVKIFFTFRKKLFFFYTLLFHFNYAAEMISKLHCVLNSLNNLILILFFWIKFYIVIAFSIVNIGRYDRKYLKVLFNNTKCKYLQLYNGHRHT